MRSRKWTSVGVIVLSLGLVLTAAPAATAAPLPQKGHAQYSWKAASCAYSSSLGGHVARGQIRTLVYKLPGDFETVPFYQKTTISIQRQVLGGGWRNMEKRTYRGPDFHPRDLVYYTTSGVKTRVSSLNAYGGTFRVKAIVRLRRNFSGLPDSTVWRYSVRSATFNCGGGDFNPFPPPQTPSTG